MTGGKWPDKGSAAVGNHLRTLRQAHAAMSQEQLAEAVGVTRQTVIAIEAGRYAPSLELAMRLARVFGLGVEAVFHWKENER